MKILSDEDIPGVDGLFSRIGEVRLMPGHLIGPVDLEDIDVLLVRSVTRVTSGLLSGSHLQFVATATAGTDHVDLQYLKDRGIGFAHAPGANAESVVEYVLAALSYLAFQFDLNLGELSVGIIGAGRIGGRLAKRMGALGCKVYCNDPPRERREDDFFSTPLNELLESSDIVSLHVPLTRGGEFPTERLFGTEQFNGLRDGAWFVNTSRGEVVDESELVAWRTSEVNRRCVIDVWNNEPAPETEVANIADLATPHIAGYGVDGKQKATELVFQAVCQHSGISDEAFDRIGSSRDTLNPAFKLVPPVRGQRFSRTLDAVVRQMYDISKDDGRFRKALGNSDGLLAEKFILLRKNYPVRRTFSRYWLRRHEVEEQVINALAHGIGIRIVD